MYEQYLTTPGQRLHVPEMSAAALAMEPRLAVLLGRAVPGHVYQEARAIHRGNGTIMEFDATLVRSLSILLAAFEYASPGGMEERKGLQ